MLNQPSHKKKKYNKGFERLKTNRKKKTIAAGSMTAGLICGVVALFVIVLIAVFFTVQEIKIDGGEEYDENEIIKASGIEKGINLYLIDDNAVSTNILSKFPYVSKVKVVRNIPTTVVLKLETDKPLFYLEIEGQYFLLTNNLRVVDITESSEEIISKYPSIKKIITGEISKAISGQTLEFVKSNYYEQIKDFMDLLCSSEVFEGLTTIDISDRFAIELVYNHTKKIEMGDTTNAELKIRFMYEIIKDLGEQCALIDVQDVETGYAIPKFEKIYD